MITTAYRGTSQTSYRIKKVVREADFDGGLYLLLELAKPANPLEARQHFAKRVKTYLENTNTNPALKFDIEPLFVDRVLSVIGYDDDQTRVGVNVKSGENKEREIIIQPTINPNGFIERYKSVLERDLVV